MMMIITPSCEVLLHVHTTNHASFRENTTLLSSHETTFFQYKNNKSRDICTVHVDETLPVLSESLCVLTELLCVHFHSLTV